MLPSGRLEHRYDIVSLVLVRDGVTELVRPIVAVALTLSQSFHRGASHVSLQTMLGLTVKPVDLNSQCLEPVVIVSHAHSGHVVSD